MTKLRLLFLFQLASQADAEGQGLAEHFAKQMDFRNVADLPKRQETAINLLKLKTIND